MLRNVSAPPPPPENRTVYNVEKYGAARGSRWQYSGTFHAGVVSLHALKHTPAAVHPQTRTHARAHALTQTSTRARVRARTHTHTHRNM